MADFSIAIRKVLSHEGCSWDAHDNLLTTGYCDEPADPGGETIYGITRREATENGWTGAMMQMPLQFAKDIYYNNYWLPLCCDNIEDQTIAEKLFDTAVNCGAVTAVRMLQRALNSLNLSLWHDVAVDGVMGGTSACTVNEAVKSKPYMRECILRVMMGLQTARYVEICEKNPSLKTFMRGWVRNRCYITE